MKLFLAKFPSILTFRGKGSNFKNLKNLIIGRMSLFMPSFRMSLTVTLALTMAQGRLSVKKTPCLSIFLERRSKCCLMQVLSGGTMVVGPGINQSNPRFT